MQAVIGRWLDEMALGGCIARASGRAGLDWDWIGVED